MKVAFDPEVSELGLIRVEHEIVENETGILCVAFRFKPQDLGIFTDGFQMQFETIKIEASRGAHYHYPESAYESFYLLKGRCALAICNLRSMPNRICEVYHIEKGITYSVPGMIPHRAINLSDEEEVEIMVAKPFNYRIINRTELVDMSWVDEVVESLEFELG